MVVKILWDEKTDGEWERVKWIKWELLRTWTWSVFAELCFISDNGKFSMTFSIINAPMPYWICEWVRCASAIFCSARVRKGVDMGEWAYVCACPCVWQWSAHVRFEVQWEKEKPVHSEAVRRLSIHGKWMIKESPTHIRIRGDHPTERKRGWGIFNIQNATKYFKMKRNVYLPPFCHVIPLRAPRFAPPQILHKIP